MILPLCLKCTHIQILSLSSLHYFSNRITIPFSLYDRRASLHSVIVHSAFIFLHLLSLIRGAFLPRVRACNRALGIIILLYMLPVWDFTIPSTVRTRRKAKNMARGINQNVSFADYKYQCENVDFHMMKLNTA